MFHGRDGARMYVLCLGCLRWNGTAPGYVFQKRETVRSKLVWSWWNTVVRNLGVRCTEQKERNWQYKHKKSWLNLRIIELVSMSRKIGTSIKRIEDHHMKRLKVLKNTEPESL